MVPKLKQLLDYLEDTLNDERITSAESLHRAALSWQEVPRLPVIATYPYPKEAEYQPFPHGQIFDDPEKMLFNQLVNAFETSLCLIEKVGDDSLAAIRADFGCVLIASMFGGIVEQVDNNPPWIRHDKNEITYDQMIHKSLNDLNMNWISKAVSRCKYYRDILADYRQLRKLINLTLPDLQGPFDNLELIRGSEIFHDMYIHQEDFLEAMQVVTKAQIEMTKHFLQCIHESQPGFSHQHGFPLKGGILIRNDTSIMVSPQMYRDLIAPFDQQILEQFGGGIHSCGDVNRIIPEYLALKSIECFDFGQSELNDIEAIYPLASEKRIPLMRVAVAEEELTSGSIHKKYPTGVSLIFRANSFEHAIKVIADYKAHSVE